MDIEVNDVAKRYGTTVAVSDVSFGVEQGHVLSLLGPSGCGKTTVMRMIAGLIAPSARLDRHQGQAGEPDPGAQAQCRNAVPELRAVSASDVAHNIAFGLEMRKLPKAEALRRPKPRSRWCGSKASARAIRTSSPAASSSASRSRARW